MRKQLETYKINAEGIELPVVITGGPGLIPEYELVLVTIGVATNAMLDEVRNELIEQVTISSKEILDPKIIAKLKATFMEKANVILMQKLPNLAEKVRKYLIAHLLHEMLGLGKLEFLLQDEHLEEIIINSASEPVRVYHRKYGWLLTNIIVDTEAKIQNYSNIIARRVGRQITTLTPLLDAHLVSGDRANAVLYPVSNKGNTITIRKFARDPWTVTDFITSKTCSAEVFALIWLAMQYEMNILVSGGTGSGKTSMLGVCLPFIPYNHRILTVEDARELQLPEHLFWCPLTTRQPNPEGKGEVSMLDLLINALRMRPDRIILGEVRKARDAEVLFEAMHTGHSVYATLHADSMTETISRIVNPPISVPANLLSAVHLNVVMFRDRRQGIRRVFQIGEFITTDDEGKVSAKPNLLYRWKASNDSIVAHGDRLHLYEQLSRHTGMSMQEITKDLAAKEKILNWMVKNNLRTIADVGKIMKQYYLDSAMIVEAATKNTPLKKVLG